MDTSNILPLIAGAALVFVMARQFLGKTSSTEAHRLVKEGARLIDVRTPGEFAGGHIEGAVNIPLQDLEKRVGEVGAPDRPVVVYCQSGMRSSSAAGLLKRHGFKAVYDLGAISRW